jgi:RNA polymerase sigma-70 factor, ECF subfamily
VELILTEMDLVQRAKQGDLTAFSQLMDQYLPYVRSLAVRFVGNESDADDVAQEVFISAYKYFKTFRGSSQFKTWLYRITINQSYKVMKRMKRNRSDLPLNDEVAVLQDSAVSQLSQLIQKDDIERMYLIIQELPKKQRTVLLLRLEQELPFKDIAKIMRRSVGGVKANYFHAVNKLRKAMKKEDPS